MPEVSLSPAAYRRNPDGSWTTIQNTEIVKPFEVTDGLPRKAWKNGIIRLKPGMTFEKGQLSWDIDVAALLDKAASG